VPPQTKAPNKGKRPNPSLPSTLEHRAWRVNPRALIALGLILGVVSVLAVVTWVVQAKRGRPALLAQAKKLVAVKQDDLALSYLRSYLADNPKDFDALEIRNEVLTRNARSPDQFDEAIRSGEAALRVNSSMSAKGLALRRRLISAYLAIGPMVPVESRKYTVAEAMANELAKETGKAADLRLHSHTLERTASLADVTRAIEFSARPPNPGTAEAKAMAMNPLIQTVNRLQQARKLEPQDVVTSEILARLDIRLKQPAKADAVFEDLLKVNSSPLAFLAVARFYASLAEEARTSGRSAEAPAHQAAADAMIARAIKAAPHDLDVRLEAASLAIATKKIAAASEHLDQVEEKDRQDYRYLTSRGIVSLLQNKTNDAVDNWSRGLLNTGGTEAELSWRLAYVQLHLGRVDEGAELIKQYRRLVGNPAGGSAASIPAEARYLEGFRLLKLNQPNDALVEFEKGRLTVPNWLKPQYYLTMGMACEATRNDVKALEEYDEAIKADPKFPAPRLARARLLQNDRLETAVDELKLSLNALGEDPAILITLARLELERLRRLPPTKRSWDSFKALLERGKKAAPSAAALAVVEANAMTMQGAPEAANDLLRTSTAINKTDPDLWVARVEKEMALGQLEKALLILDQAMDPKAAGDQASLRILKAKILTYRGHGAEAREALTQDVESVPIDQRHRLWMALGELYMAQGDARSLISARKAFAEWSKMLADDPLPRLFVLELALSDPTEDGAAAVKDSLAVLKKAGGLYDLIGQATYRLRQKKAVKDSETESTRNQRLAEVDLLIEKIEKQAPQLRYGHLLRGELMRQRNDLAAAARAYEKAMKTDGGRSLALPRLVSIYTEMGEAGRSNLERLRATVGPDAARNIARIQAETFARQGNKDRAEELAREVVLGAEESLDVRIWEARLLNTLGKPKEAEAALRTLIDKHTDTLGPWMALIYFQISREDPKAAVKTVESMMGAVKNLERPELVWGQAWRVVGERDRADAAFDAATLKWADDPRVGRAAAEYYTATGRPEKAETIFTNALKRDPDGRWAVRGLALILSSRPGDESAWLSAWKLVKDPARGGDLPEDRLIRAVVLARGPDATNREAASPILFKLVEDLPADLPAAALARRTLVDTLIKSDPGKAAEFAAVDANAPNATPAAITLHTSALIAAKQLDDAGRQLDRLNTLVPDDASTVTLRARLLRARGNGTEAATALVQEAPEKIKGPGGEAIGRLIVQTLLNELDQPEAAFKVASLLFDRYPDTTANVKASVLAHQGHRKEALELYLQAVKAGDPKNVREAARSSLSMITRDKYDPASIALAEQVIDAARLKDPKSSDLLAMAGYLRHFQDRPLEEMKIYEEALKGQPEDFTLMNNMAWNLSERLEKPEEALVQINKAFNKTVLAPSQLYDTRGCIYTRLGRYDDAIRDLEIAVRDRPTGLMWAHLARAYSKAGNNDKFEEAKNRAKTSTPPLTPDMIERAERVELEPLIFGK
jgi:tetratricopeptide (TPR) repeat protein